MNGTAPTERSMLEAEFGTDRAGGRGMTRTELNGLSILALAHVGDAVYELLVRTYLAGHGQARGD